MQNQKRIYDLLTCIFPRLVLVTNYVPALKFDWFIGLSVFCDLEKQLHVLSIENHSY